MTIEEKYNIVYENGKRYYVFDVATKLPVLDNTVPYYFKCGDIEIYESSWNRMTIRILEEIDKLFPKTEEELLSIRYWWSKQSVFSRTKKTNFTPYKNLFLNTNHTSTHAMMSIQCLLKEYNINLSECYLLIRRHFITEPEEVKKHFKSKTILEFKNSLQIKGFKLDRIETAVKNFDIINKFLCKVSTGFNDFFLFDDYNYFSNYKIKTLEEVQSRFPPEERTYIVIKRCLDYLDDFYKNRIYYQWLTNHAVSADFIMQVEKELWSLFENLKTNIVVGNKLYARMSFYYKRDMEKLEILNNPDGLFKICSIFLRKKFYFKEPYISKNPIKDLTNDQIINSYAYSLDDFTISDLNAYIQKMHLKKLDNYLEFIIACSNEYVQVDMERLISKSIFNVSKDVISLVKREVLFYINSFGVLNSENYAGYDSLPKMRFKWNKYLLIGVIRSYLSADFKIMYTANNYKNQSYIIDIKNKNN